MCLDLEFETERNHGFACVALHNLKDNNSEVFLGRFLTFSRAVMEATKRLNWPPDVIHRHDWQTGTVPALDSKLPEQK